MILIDDAKHACVECIRGHRSSLCKHHARPLLQVRSKGRPNIRNNPNYRVAVFCKQIDHESSNNKTIKVLEASIKYIIDFKTSDIIGPYDQETAKQKLQPDLKINDDSFINKTFCCSQTLKNQSCGCKGSSKSKILKQYLTRRRFTFINNNDEAKQESLKQQLNRSLSCTVPGSCTCDDDCICAGCVDHGNDSNFIPPVLEYPQHGHDNQQDFMVFATTTNNDNNGISIDNNSNVNGTKFNNGGGEMANRLEDVEGYNHISNFNISDMFSGNLSELQQSLSMNSFQLQSPQPSIDSPQEDSICRCNPEECKCTNCETHGIINGIRLDDIFKNIA